MRFRQVMAALGVVTLVATMMSVLPSSSAGAILPAPKNLTVARTDEDAYRIRVSWGQVASVDHYEIDFLAGDVQTVLDLPGTTSAYVIDAPNPCTAYKVRIGAVDAAGNVSRTGYVSLRPLTPTAVMGLTPGRADDGTTATASWRAPAWAGYTALTGYRAVLTRLSDSTVLADRTSADTTFRYAGIDATKAYTLAVTTINEFGACVTAKSLMDRYRPADPTGLVVKRLAASPDSVQVTWNAAASGPDLTYYQVGYGTEKTTRTVRADPQATSVVLPLAADKSWVVEVKAYNANGGSSAATGTVPIWDEPADTSTQVVSGGSDVTPPTITTTLSQKAVNGWFRTPVTIQFTCDDDSGRIASCTRPVVAATDGAALRYSGTAQDAAGNTATTTLTVRVDQKAPKITATVLGTRNDLGWYTSAPTIRYTCGDEVSQIASCPADTSVTTNGAGQEITGIALDKAGNSATTTVRLNIDQIAPRVDATVLSEPNSAGWYTTPPTVRYVCVDVTSGMAVCPDDTTVTTDGDDQAIVEVGVDRAGNTTAATVRLDIDRTAPRVSATVLGQKNGAGWYTTAPTVHFTCTDATSGVATCPADITVTTDGAGQEITGTAADRAGNTATTTVRLDIDRTAPGVSATVLSRPNGAGWYTTAPTVHFTCTDAGSGVATCPADTTVTTDGAGQQVSGSAKDKAGNTGSGTVPVSVDRSAPVVTVAGATDGTVYGPDAAPAVSCATTDKASGVATAATMTHVSNRDRHTVTCSGAVDKAGNTAAPVQVSYSVKPTTAWLIALTRQYASKASASTLKQLEKDLTAGRITAYTSRVLSLSQGAKPVVTPPQAGTLVVWAASLCLFP